MKLFLSLLVAFTLSAQTGNPLADQAIADITALAADASFGAAVRAACGTCQAVILNIISSQSNLTGVQICCGTTTVPPTPVALPPGYSLMIFSPVPSQIITGGLPH